jgi:hypothetical protein
MSADRMPISRGIAPLADIPDGECRDGGPKLVIRGEHPVIAMPVVPRWRHEIGQSVQEVTRREFDDAVLARPRGLAPAPLADPEAARFHDYRRASSPLGDAGVPPIPGGRFAAALHEQGPTRILPLDTSAILGCPGPATTPSLCANFVRIHSRDAVVTDANATSQLFFVMRGTGKTRLAVDGGIDMPAGTEIPWQAGDLFTLPAKSAATLAAVEDAAFYWVHDEPLLRHLGALATTRRFGPTLCRHEAIREALEAVVRDPESARANRLSVLLGNHFFPQSMTVTHVLWAMFGILPVGVVQPPHGNRPRRGRRCRLSHIPPSLWPPSPSLGCDD